MFPQLCLSPSSCLSWCSSHTSPSPTLTTCLSLPVVGWRPGMSPIQSLPKDLLPTD